jgi:hypothetical protein
LLVAQAPSEYFIDSKTHTLYFIPPSGASVANPIPGQGAFLSQEPIAHTIDGASSVVLRGLRLEYAMGTALSARNISDVTVDNCTISNSGTDGVQLQGRNSTLSGCEIFDVGCNAVVMAGGDIPSLTPGNLLVHNNSLHRFARVSRTVVSFFSRSCSSVLSQFRRIVRSRSTVCCLPAFATT